MNAELLRRKVDEPCHVHEYDQIEATLLEYKDITEHDNDLAKVYYLMGIYKQEKAAGKKTILEKWDILHPSGYLISVNCSM